MKKSVYLLGTALLFMLAGCGTSKESSAKPDFITRDESELFSSRDRESGYDEADAIPIVLEQNTASCSSNKVSVSDSTVTITDEGTYLLSGSLDGMIIVDAGKQDKIQLVLDNVSVQCSDNAPVYIRQADKVFLTSVSGSENTLTASGEFTSLNDSSNIDGAIFSKEDLTLNGSDSLNVRSNLGHGIVSKDSLVITGGSYTIDAAKHGLSGKDDVSISGGTFQITAGKDGIHGANQDDASLGFLYIADGTFDITAGDDGLHSDADLTICNGTIRILESYEGIEGKNITIQGGTITVVSSDDGLNASAGNSEGKETTSPAGPAQADSSLYILLSGGTLTVNASGDGLDSNGNLYITGGEIFVSGSENGGNSALDYNGEAQITGGIVAAAGFIDMAQNFSDSSTQGALLAEFDLQAAETELSLKDSEGNTLITYTPAKQYNSVVFSHPALTASSSYTLQCGDVDTEITMETMIQGKGSEMGTPRRNHEMEKKDMPQQKSGEHLPEMPEGSQPSDRPEMPEGSQPSDKQQPSDTL
ncbi:MAG: carbohydrate-binding domain-containing protein [Lachnospiraceae bacterium]|nr:carbohydrate-binding domain-containing protein [Lachnospiraceae bacterium]